jgi:hypothetical protein
MSLFVLDTVLWIIGIRGHIPQNDGFRIGPSDASFSVGTLVRGLAGFVLSVVVLSLLLWTAVWLAIKLL